MPQFTAASTGEGLKLLVLNGPRNEFALAG
jgi:hypothetical protein